MDWLQALILGIIQGLTEYLPVSSSGHLVIGQEFFGLDSGEGKLAFTVLLHVATVLSTIVILWKEIIWIFSDLFKFTTGHFAHRTDFRKIIANIYETADGTDINACVFQHSVAFP